MEHSNNHPSAEHSTVERSLLIVVGALGLGLVFDLLFFEKIPGISFPLYVILTLASLLGFARLQKREVPKAALNIIPLVLFFSAMVFVRAGDFLTFINIVLSFYLLALFVWLTLRPDIHLYSFEDYLRPLLRLPSLAIRKLREVLGTAFAGQTFFAKHRSLPQVLRGVFIALPVLVLFLLLFSSADLVFRQYVADIFDFHINGDLLWHVFWIVSVAAAFVGVFGVIGQQSAVHQPGVAAGKVRRFGFIEMSIVFGSLNVLFLSFILVQLAYLFGGISNVVGGDFTYAEYARKGFFELIAVAGLSLLLIVVTERLLLREAQTHSPRFKVLAGALIVQVFIIMISAIKRLHLYEGAYGFTSLRVMSYVFIAWLAVVFLLLLRKIIANQREHSFAFAVFVSAMAFLIFVNCLNVDGLVARKNIDRYQATGKLDVQYLQYLSDDAVTQVSRLLSSKDPQVRRSLAIALYPRQQALRAKDGVWQSTNVTRKAALRALDKHAGLLEASKDYSTDPSYRGPGQ